MRPHPSPRPFLPRFGLAALISGAACLALAAPPAIAADDGSDPGATAVGMSPIYYPYAPAQGHQASFAYAATVDKIVDGKRVPDVWLSYSETPDSADVPPSNAMLVSHDGGVSFTDRRPSSPLGAGTMAQLSDGSLMALDFVPSISTGSTPTWSIQSRQSTDMGKTWKVVKGKVTLPKGMAFTTDGFDKGMRIHKGLMQLPDGTILAGAYGKFAGEPAWSSFILQSTDKGKSWTLRGRPGAPTTSVGTSEMTMSRTSDGRMIAVMRGAPETSGLVQSVSTDDGRTWSKPTKIDVPGAHAAGAVEPSLLLQPNGVLILAYGRPDNHILISPSGTGDDWQSEQQVFANPPANGPSTHGSSGNNSLAPLDASRTLIVGDTCAPWGCQEYDETYKVFARQIDAVGPGTGKLDLRQMVADGRATITGTFAKPDKRLPQTRPEAIVDGSSSPMAAAKLAGSKKTPAQVTIALDQPYSIGKIGLMLANGTPSDAVVQLSTDGKTWSAPVVTADKRVDYAMKYQDIDPRKAQYVRVSAPQGGTLPAVDELELYRSDTDTFENEVVRSVPRGWTNATGASVIDAIPAQATPQTPGYKSSRALRLLDLDPNAQARIDRPFSPRTSFDVSLEADGINRQGGFIVDVQGTAADGSEKPAYSVTIDPISGQVRAYDGTSWNVIGTLSKKPNPSEWFAVRIKGDTSSATVSVNGQDFALSSPRTATTQLTGLSFSSAGTAFTGSSYLIDDLTIG